MFAVMRYLGVAQFGSVLEWGSRGREFDSRHSDQRDKGAQKPLCRLTESRSTADGQSRYNSHANGGVAHLGERLNGIQEVVGSIPIISTSRSRDIRSRDLFFFPP